MRPVVSSIVALAIAIAPFAAMASPEKSAGHKPVAAKVVKHQAQHHKKTAKVDKVEKTDKVVKGDKPEKADKGSSIVHVKHEKKDGALKPVLHHAHGVEVGGAGHKEPKVEHGVSVVPASMHSKTAHAKPEKASHKQPAEMPKLPNPNATKASKAGSEKGAKKPTEKKNDDGGDKDGKAERDEASADLVARKNDGKSDRAKVLTKVDIKIDSKGEATLEARVDTKPDATDPKAEKKAEKKAKPGAKAPVCAKDPIEIIRGPEIDTFALTKCDGTIAPLAIEHLSVLIRPGSAARPVTPLADLAKKKGDELAQGIRRVDPRLAIRLQSLADHFGKTGSPVKLSVVSGYRPTSTGSMHATGRAIDFRLEGAKNEDVVAFCKTLSDTGCGYYPNSSFVHLDVRDPGAGHVSWIDASGPGETPRYVSSWPPPRSRAHDGIEPASAKESAAKSEKTEKSESEDAPEAVDAHPLETAP